MNWEDIRKFISEQKKGIIVGAVAALLIRSMLR